MDLNEKYFQLGIGLRLITSGWDDMRDAKRPSYQTTLSYIYYLINLHKRYPQNWYICLANILVLNFFSGLGIEQRKMKLEKSQKKIYFFQ